MAHQVAYVQAITYLERGSQGYVQCPLITSKRFSPESVSAMHWYFNGQTTPYRLASHFHGSVHIKPGLPEGVYDIDGNFSLVIHHVTDSMEGNYVFKLVPIGKLAVIRTVPVTVKVSPETPRPRVVGCNNKNTSPSTCEVTADATQTHNLTCVVENAKPAVNISIARLGDNQMEMETHQKHQLHLENSTSPDLFKINNTFTTSASVSVPVPTDGVKYRCEASGVAIGSRANNHVTVIIRRNKQKKDKPASRDDIWNGGDSLTSTRNVLILMATTASAVIHRVCY